MASLVEWYLFLLTTAMMLWFHWISESRQCRANFVTQCHLFLPNNCLSHITRQVIDPLLPAPVLSATDCVNGTTACQYLPGQFACCVRTSWTHIFKKLTLSNSNASWEESAISESPNCFCCFRHLESFASPTLVAGTVSMSHWTSVIQIVLNWLGIILFHDF